MIDQFVERTLLIMAVQEIAGMSLDGLLTSEIVQAVSAAQHKEEALRIALLHCIVLLRDREDAAAKNYCTFLLSAFEPLTTGYHGDNIHTSPAWEFSECLATTGAWYSASNVQIRRILTIQGRSEPTPDDGPSVMS